MKTLELSEEERRELASLIAVHLSDVRVEMLGTNSIAFRQALRRREFVLATLLHHLE